MKNRMVIALVSVALVGGLQLGGLAFAADADKTKVSAKPAVNLVIPKKKSMAEKGSFHIIHEKKGKLDCEDCHEKGGLPDNTVMLRLHDPLPKKSPGAVDHNGCLTCHKDLGNPVARYAKK